MKLKTSLIISILSSIVTVFVAGFILYNYVPLSTLDKLNVHPHLLGTTITTINGSDTLAASRTVLNNNFSALNTGKVEVSDLGASTTMPQITTLANLSTVGTIISGIWSGTAIAQSKGGTGTTTYYNGGVNFYNSTLSAISQSATPANFFWDETNKRLGVGTSSPWGQLSINPNGVLGPAFTIGSSTRTLFQITNGGMLGTCTSAPATSTAMVIDWSNTCPKVLLRMAATAFSITFVNATTSMMDGSNKLVTVCNQAAGTAGALTWTKSGTDILWVSKTLPTQTTTANSCDAWSFYVTQATSTSAYVIFGAMTPNY